MKAHHRSGRKRPTRHWAGQSAIEFALVLPLFLLLVFGVMDFARLLFTQMSVQFAMREAGRFAVTGNRLPDPQSTNVLSRVDSIKLKAQQASGGMDVSQIQISHVVNGQPQPGPGGPGDTLTISLTVDLKLMTPLIAQFFGPEGVYTFTSSTTFKSEPFPPD